MMSMTETNTSQPASRGLSQINLNAVVTVVLAGAVSLIVWELWARGISPAIDWPRPNPVDLASAVLKKTTGISDRNIAEVLHYFTGLVAYPAAYVFAVQPLAKRFAPIIPWWVVATAFGVSTFVFALYVMAHLVMGWAPFLGCGAVAQTSLIGHTLLGIALGAIVQLREQTAPAVPLRQRTAH